MDHPLIDLINLKIAEAEADGAFDDLEGAGKPLPQVEDPENALLNRLVKESGGVPEFVSLTREMARLRAELRENWRSHPPSRHHERDVDDGSAD